MNEENGAMTTQHSTDSNHTAGSDANTIDVKNLCSRKLWELLAIECPKQLDKQAKTHIEQELVARQHYVKELHHWRQQTC